MKPRRRRSRRWLSRRGISTVVANMMMIGITLSLGAILVAWAGQSYGAFSGGSQLYFQQRGQALQENFVIEEVFFNRSASPQQIFVFVRNVGLININLVAIYVNGTSLTPVTTTGHGWCTSYFGSASSASLGVGSVCEYSLQWPSSSCSPNYCPWNSGNIFYIVIASMRGNQVTYTARAP
jgi:archaellum component FlaF (FlaF/FlaG flagellin family)